jgi:hypothetical protein
MKDSLIFAITAVKRLREAAIHTPTFIGCNRVFLQMHVDFLKSIFYSFALRPKKKLMSNNLQTKLKNLIVEFNSLLLRTCHHSNCSKTSVLSASQNHLVEVLEVL